MKKILIVPLLLLAAACGQSAAERAEDECRIAVHGLKDSGELTIGPLARKCMGEIREAEYVAREKVLEQYRQMPRLKKEEENAD